MAPTNKRPENAKAGEFKKGNPGGPGRPKGRANRATLEAKKFCQSLLDSPAYQQRFRTAFVARKLPPDLEKLVWSYAAGKPATTLNVAAGQDLVELLAAFSKPKGHS